MCTSPCNYEKCFFSQHEVDCALQGVDLYWYHRGSVRVFIRTCARAGTAAGVSHPSSHNEEGRRLDLFIRVTFVSTLAVSGCAYRVKRHRCTSLHQTTL